MSNLLFPVVEVIGAIIFFAVFIRLSRIMVFISNQSIGVVEKIWSLKGSIKTGFLAMDGSAGFQPQILRGGIHFFAPFQYRIHVRSLPSVPQGTIGYVFARSGKTLEPGQTLGSLPSGVTFDDARGFIQNGGQKGPQRTILREGVYALNVAQFVLLTSEGTHAISLDDSDKVAITKMHQEIESRGGFSPVVLRDKADQVGVVTIHDGPSLDHGQLIAPTVGTDPKNCSMYHNCFQNIENFLAAGGRRGRQDQVLVEGTYYLNALFATVECLPKTIIDIGKVGVVVSYTGETGNDITGKDYKHGELVENGSRGVWARALQAGKYALNPEGIKVIPVPTTNFVLRWIEGSTEQHGYDAGLAEIKLITRDAFEPILPLSIVLHIAYEDAPRVVQQFADLKLLVEQTIDPMVSAYFKDAAQAYTLLQLVSARSEIQKQATVAMKERFSKYHLNLMEVMIGTPRPAEGDTHMATILDQLRARQVADEQAVTYENQKKAAEKEREMREAMAAADAQTSLTQSTVQIQISENNGKAQLALRSREAEAIKITAGANAEAVKLAAGANAEKIRVEGNAEADKIAAIGAANAKSVEAQVKAFGGPEYQLRKEIAQIMQVAIEGSKVPLVPTVVVAGKDGGSGSPLDALLGMVMGEKFASAKPAALPPVK